ncbi:hypothetical protein Q5P01_012038 [Channa striata]|uniref:Uncharacterized protein n=1 Tax=Channa striata TaxID=64152 RepID=A0AA88SMF7_CHASR|nr:hypothetical protein Q5P01_012038 [Channa striata]
MCFILRRRKTSRSETSSCSCLCRRAADVTAVDLSAPGCGFLLSLRSDASVAVHAPTATPHTHSRLPSSRAEGSSTFEVLWSHWTGLQTSW